MSKSSPDITVRGQTWTVDWDYGYYTALGPDYEPGDWDGETNSPCSHPADQRVTERRYEDLRPAIEDWYDEHRPMPDASFPDNAILNYKLPGDPTMTTPYRIHTDSSGGAPYGYTDRHPSDRRASHLLRPFAGIALLASVVALAYCTQAKAEPVDRAQAIAALQALPALPTAAPQGAPDARLVTQADVKTYSAAVTNNITPLCQPLTGYSRTGALTPLGGRSFSYRMLAAADTLAFPCTDGTVYLILAYRR